MANFWMHNGFLQVEGEKMSKSLGNFVTIRELLDTPVFGGRAWPGAALRLAMLRTHYRQPIDWTVRALEESDRALERFAETIDFGARRAAPRRRSPPRSRTTSTRPRRSPICMRCTARRAAAPRPPPSFRADAEFLGLDLAKFARQIARPRRRPRRSPSSSASSRSATWRGGGADWAASDRLRDELAALGVAVKDGKDGAKWEFKR